MLIRQTLLDCDHKFIHGYVCSDFAPVRETTAVRNRNYSNLASQQSYANRISIQTMSTCIQWVSVLICEYLSIRIRYERPKLSG